MQQCAMPYLAGCILTTPPAMHNLKKIRIFRLLLALTWLPSLILLYPIVLLRRRSSSRHFFLFDRYCLGGAQRVHLDILNSIPELPKSVYFTRSSPDSVMKSEFEATPGTACHDIHFWCDNLFFRMFSVHYLAFYLNRHQDIQIFSANSTFFYDLLPFLKKGITRTELLHNFTYGKNGMEFFGLANHRYLDRRLTVDHVTAQNIKDQYEEFGVPAVFRERVQVIEPGVIVPERLPEKGGKPLKVLYAGRGGAQKRIWLIDRIAGTIVREQTDMEFHFAGTMMEELSPAVKAAAVIHGQIDRQEDMQALYRQCDVLLMTSAYEGFPMFIKEGMAFGCIPVVTGLPGNKTHLRHGENALLLEPVQEEGVVTEGIEALRYLVQQPDIRKGLQASAHRYARTHFDKSVFKAAYRQLLLGAARER